MSVSPTATETLASPNSALESPQSYDIHHLGVNGSATPTTELVLNGDPPLVQDPEVVPELPPPVDIDLTTLDPAVVNEIKLDEAARDPLASVLALNMDVEPVGPGGPIIPSGEVDFTRDFGDDQRRVKVYELIDSRWTDKGTAFCHSAYDEKRQLAKLIARSEDCPDDILLQIVIRGEDVYQRQQETLIVWTEPDGRDYALSFQDVEGCSDVWDYILDVQRAVNGDQERDENEGPSSSPLGERPITFATIVNNSHLPQPQFGIMLEVERAIKHVGRHAGHRDKLCEHILATDYVRLMIDLAIQAEDLEQLQELHALCSCMHTILLLNDHNIFEYVVSDDLFVGVCGILEYDPEFPTHKACFREILTEHSQFKQPIPFTDAAVRRKIQQTYRLQFLKDVVLTRVMEDSTFNVLNSCIIFNQIDLINSFQQDESFIRQVVGIFTDPALLSPPMFNDPKQAASPLQALSDPQSAESKDLVKLRTDVIFLIQQLCVMGKNVQLQARLLLFRFLVDRGLIHAVQWGLTQRDAPVVSTSAEVLAILLEHDINGIRQHIMRQADVEPENSLVQVISIALAGPGDLALKNQLSDCLKTLLETLPPEGPETGIKAIIRQREDPVIEKFLEFIYNRGCIKGLFKPFADLPEHATLPDPPLFLTSEKSVLYFYLSELLCCAINQHGFRSSLFILDSAISTRIASLLSSRDKHLRLAALRVFRAYLKLNNRNIVNHLMKHNILLPIIELTIRETRRDNLLSSCCQDFFEYIRKENMKDLIGHIMSKYESKIRPLMENPIVGPRFLAFVRRWEQNCEPPPVDERKPRQAVHLTKVAMLTSSSDGLRKKWLEDDDDWFIGSDDDEYPPVGPQPPWIQQQLANQPPRKKRRFKPGLSLDWPSRKRQAPSPTPANSPQASGLVDYEGDDEGASPSESSKSAESSRPQSLPIVSISNSLIASTSPTSPSLRVKAPQPIKLPTLGAPTDLLVSASPTEEIGTSINGGTPPQPEAPPQRGDKRRREEDDDDLLVRLASKGKKRGMDEARPSASPSPTVGSDSEGKAQPGSKKEDGPAKRIKLRLGSIANVVTRRASREAGDGG